MLRTTSYLADVLSTLRAEGLDVDDDMTARLTLAQHDHINFYGTYSFALDTELSRERRRPLRQPA